MSEKIYPKGIMCFPKHDKAPEFVLGSCVITIADFKDFVNQNQQLLTDYQGKKQLRLQILNGQKGIYFQVDTYKPEAKQTTLKDDLKPFLKSDIGGDDVPDLPF